MADADYQRLSAACHCGEPVKLWSGRGRPPKYCGPPCSEKAKMDQQNRSNRAAYVARPKVVKCCMDCGVMVETRSSGLKRCVTCRRDRDSNARRKAFGVSGVCERCSAAFTAKIAGAKYCGAACRRAASNDLSKIGATHTCETCRREFRTHRVKKNTRWCSDECKPKALRGLFSCLHCGLEYKRGPRHGDEGKKYCSRECCFAMRAALKSVRIERSAPTLCAYFAKHCERCGMADGGKRDWSLCLACKRGDSLAAGREAARAWNEAKHKAEARESACDECGAVYCQLYGCKPGPRPLCAVCQPVRQRQNRRAAKIKRCAAERGAEAENVNPWKVFARDGWKCRLCGVDTPRRLRGSIEHNAPELDHVVPLSRGGPHTYANTQCLCRSCNGFKSDRTMDEVAAALAA